MDAIQLLTLNNLRFLEHPEKELPFQSRKRVDTRLPGGFAASGTIFDEESDGAIRIC